KLLFKSLSFQSLSFTTTAFVLVLANDGLIFAIVSLLAKSTGEALYLALSLKPTIFNISSDCDKESLSQILKFFSFNVSSSITSLFEVNFFPSIILGIKKELSVTPNSNAFSSTFPLDTMTPACFSVVCFLYVSFTSSSLNKDCSTV